MTNLEWALFYARRGWAVFPCHTCHNGKCSCGDDTCSSPGKHPRTPSGYKDATTDKETIRNWWKKWPDSNIGFAVPDNIVVVDVDIKHHEGKYGDKSISEWEQAHGELPKTVTSLTGGGGKQHLYSTDKPLTNKIGILPSVDIKTIGGYVILPPSTHASGKRYGWDIVPNDMSLAELPEALYQLIKGSDKSVFKSMEIPDEIPTGERNNILFKAASSLRATGYTKKEILKMVSIVNQERCCPPIEGKELKDIVNSVGKYIQGDIKLGSLRPPDFSDSGNAEIFIRQNQDKAIFVESIGWLIWNGYRWEVGNYKAVAVAMSFSASMLADATNVLNVARKKLTEAQASDDKTAIDIAKEKERNAMAYLKHAKNLRQQPTQMRMLLLSKSALLLELDRLDATPLALNTPSGVVNLKTGKMKKHSPTLYCSKITAVFPSEEGTEMWNDFLSWLTCEDSELQDFLQQLAGMFAIGKMFDEKLIIAYGDGANGKSTFFNTLANVLGDYSGTIAAEVLIDDKRNKGASLAELKGKRLVIAAELEEGKRLSTSMLKQLSSTDKISAERKYHDPESFVPSHTVVLYTNHKPTVGSIDIGTWRRLILVPFNARIKPTQDRKNYAYTLVREAGGAILSWIVEGAQKFIANGKRLIPPPIVLQATAEYQQENDWVNTFLEERCDVGGIFKESSGQLYSLYKLWTESSGNHARHIKDFNKELERKGFMLRKEKSGRFWFGLRIKRN